MRIKISFAGSFQARLATDPDPTASSPIGMAEVDPKYLGKGWTFAYNESPFDRIIRLSNPVQLRSALMDPWEDTKVTQVEASTTLAPNALSVVSGDPLFGQRISFGNAKFDAKAGGGGSFELLVDFAFSIGGNLFTAEPAKPTRMGGVSENSSWKSDYFINKPQRMGLGIGGPGTAVAMMDPHRREVMTRQPMKSSLGMELPRHLQTYGSFFTMYSTLNGMPLTKITTAGVNGILGLLKKPAALDWTLTMTFSRFDGDTLTGRLSGELEGNGP